MKILLETQYLPCLEYFACFTFAQKIYLEAHENFVKQTARNRCYILSSQKIELLSVPVSYQAPCSIQNVSVDIAQNWQQKHWRAIVSAYGKAPFFIYFKEYFEHIFAKKHENLWQLNQEMLTICLDILNIQVEILSTEHYEKNPSAIFDARNLLSSTQTHVIHKNYFQVFGTNFSPNLSILDLIFCQGTASKTYLLDLGEALKEKLAI